MTDTERLNWLEQQSGAGLISDDDIHWAVSFSGFQNVPMEPPANIDTTFFVPKADWKTSVREAIDAAMKDKTTWNT